MRLRFAGMIGRTVLTGLNHEPAQIIHRIQ